MTYRLPAAAMLAATLLVPPAFAAPQVPAKFGDPINLGDGLTLDPIAEGRLRWEHVDQPAASADAATLRLRLGGELKHVGSHLALLAEAEGTLALATSYNAFPFVIASSQRRTAYSTISDPETIELNRLQLQYRSKAITVTLGRQRINLDDQRFVGAVGWRQNEQTFDALRGEGKLGPISLDGTYAIGQRTIFGIDAGPRTAYDGNFLFLGAGTKLGQINIKGFAYLLNYKLREQGGTQALALADTQTYGARANTTLALSKQVKFNLAASYARQSDWQQNPLNYGVDYLAGEAGLAYRGIALTGGYEKLGSSPLGRSFQTPMATLHKFNGWADLFLTTPASGLQDAYASLAYAFPKATSVKGLNATVTWHSFRSASGGLSYGHEWDASLGLKTGRLTWLAKYADYSARGFGTDTRKFWLQAEFAY